MAQATLPRKKREKRRAMTTDISLVSQHSYSIPQTNPSNLKNKKRGCLASLIPHASMPSVAASGSQDVHWRPWKQQGFAAFDSQLPLLLIQFPFHKLKKSAELWLASQGSRLSTPQYTKSIPKQPKDSIPSEKTCHLLLHP